MLFAACVIGSIVWVLATGIILGVGLSREPGEPLLVPSVKSEQVTPPAFFSLDKHLAEAPAARPQPSAAYTNVSVDMLVGEIERHIRLEEAAAENFLHEPNAEVLHARTESRLAMN